MFRENELVHDHYVDLGTSTVPGVYANHKRLRDNPPYADLPWDPIDESLVGKLEVQPLRRWAGGQGLKWMSPLEQLAPGFIPKPAPQVEGECQEEVRVSVATWLGAARVGQPKDTLLFESSEVAWYPGAPCGLFGVEKPGKNVLRVIFDARPANQAIAPRGEQLVLFTLAMLVQAMAMYQYVHTVDYRHSYYQFLLPLRLAWYFFIVVDGITWLPRVLPMGFREAVTIAQCATFAVVLYVRPGESRLGIDIGALRALRSMPAYLSLYDEQHQEVGRILLLLDGVAVTCRDKALRDAWVARLRRNEDHFHVVRKETKSVCLAAAAPATAVPEPGLADEEPPVDFAGVVFDRDGWRPRAEIPEPTAVAESTPARALAARLGRVLWALRVRSAAHLGVKARCSTPR